MSNIRQKTFGEIWSTRSREELRELAQIKRFMECVMGDPLFRQKLAQSIAHPSRVAQDYGIDVQAELMLPLFHVDYMHYRFDNGDDRWPLARKWDAYMQEVIDHRKILLAAGSTASIHPRFEMWRNRQIARTQSETGDYSGGTVHPIVCYELSRGCTVGCWFCGISAAKFAGYWPFTPANEEQWRGILGTMVTRFGTAAQTGFCYWATDPSDNPDYLKFLRVHGDITGIIPQTTTAAPLKNVEMTRDILRLFEEHRHVINRFSILSLGQLRRVHATFSAEELLGVELVMHHKDALTVKALAGRAFVRAEARKVANPPGDAETLAVAASNEPEGSGTIACVSGFLVNMAEGRIKLISPTRASTRWPDGYRIYGEATFQDAAGFGEAIDTLIENHMIVSLPGTHKLSFREDLDFQEKQEGFDLLNRSTSISCNGAGFLRDIGGLVNQSNRTVSETVIELASRGTSPFLTMQCIDDLHQAGVLDEEAHHAPLYPDPARETTQQTASA